MSRERRSYYRERLRKMSPEQKAHHRAVIEAWRLAHPEVVAKVRARFQKSPQGRARQARARARYREKHHERFVILDGVYHRRYKARKALERNHWEEMGLPREVVQRRILKERAFAIRRDVRRLFKALDAADDPFAFLQRHHLGEST